MMSIRNVTVVTGCYFQAEVYDYMHQIGLPVTGVLISYLYEDMLKEPLKPKLCSPDIYTIGQWTAFFFMRGRRPTGQSLAIYSQYCNSMSYQHCIYTKGSQ